MIEEIGREGRDVPHALLAKEFLDAADRHTLIVKKCLHPANHTHIRRPIIPSTARTLDRFDLRKAAFPKPEHMSRDVQPLGDFRDGPKRLAGFFH